MGPVHAVRVDGGEPVEQHRAEVEVDVVRAAGELPLLRAMLGVASSRGVRFRSQFRPATD
jgi:hypothetical protein